MFWVESAINGNVRIVKSGLDGTRVKNILQYNTEAGRTAICLDLKFRLVYSNADNTKEIFSTDYDGNNLKKYHCDPSILKTLKNIRFHDGFLFVQTTDVVYKLNIVHGPEYRVAKNHIKRVRAWTYLNALCRSDIFHYFYVVTEWFHCRHTRIPFVCATGKREPLRKRHWQLFPFLSAVTSRSKLVSKSGVCLSWRYAAHGKQFYLFWSR